MIILEILFWLGFATIMASFVIPTPIVGVVISAIGAVVAIGALLGQLLLRKKRHG